MSNRLGIGIVVVALMFAAASCASKSNYSSATTPSEQYAAIQDLENELQKKEKQLNKFEEGLREKEAKLIEKENSIASTSKSTTTTTNTDSLFPPNPKPGECYARVLIPAKYKTTTHRVLSREASEKIEIVPAQFRTVQKRVLVQEESEKLVQVPAQYKTVTEKIIDKPAHTVWKKGPKSSDNVLSQKFSDTGEVMCLIEVPATYRTVSKQVLVSPATTKVQAIPAKYKTIKVVEMASPAREVRTEIPVQYKTVTKTAKVTEEHLEWRQVVCQINLNRSNVANLQSELKELGYYGDQVDGIIGPNTLKAANSFAKSKGLPQGSSYIAMDVVNALGLKM